MAKARKFKCIEKAGAQYKDLSGRVVFVKRGKVVVADSLYGKAGKPLPGWVFVDEDVEKVDFGKASANVEEYTGIDESFKEVLDGLPNSEDKILKGESVPENQEPGEHAGPEEAPTPKNPEPSKAKAVESKKK